MKHKTKLLFAVMCVLALPLIFLNGNAQASVYNNDGAIHDATTHTWVAPTDNGSCVGAVSTDPVGTPAHALGGTQSGTGNYCRSLAPAWLGEINDNNNAACAADGYTDCQTECLALGYAWHTYGTPHDCINNWTDDTSAAAVAGRSAHECLYCHDGGHASNRTGYLKGGHKNMSRALNDGIPWTTSIEYGSADLSGYNWNNPGTTTNGTTYTSTDSTGTPVFWIYDGWLSATPRAATPGSSYSCGRCHTTGWTADATMQNTKEPIASFGTGITADVNLSAADDNGVTQPYSSWDHFGILCSRCHNAVDGGHANSGLAADDMDPTLPAGGASQAAKCYNCHRQVDSNNLPLDAQTRLIGEELYAVSSHGGPVGIKSHANGYLNSPHARFSGTYGQLGDASQYDSHFVTYYGTCAACHNVHDSLTDTAVGAEPWNKECGLDCHSQNPSDPYAHQLSRINHPSGAGTPLANATTSDPVSACETCHMPGGIHLFRISVDPNYTTFPAANTNAATVPDPDHNNFPEAYVDLNAACGQCHGGDSATTANGAPHFDKLQLAAYAMGMHNTDSIIAVMSANYGTTNMDVTVNGSQSYCAPTATCSSFTYAWDFGDGSTGSGASATHTYSTAGEKLITLTVTDANGNEGARGKVWYAVGTSMAPTVGGTLTTDANTWVGTLTDSSAPTTDPIALVVVKWGDGTSNAQAAGSTFTHTYTNPGLFIVTQQAIDTAGRPSSVKTYASSIANFQLYTISGTVTKSDGTTPVAFATVKVVKDGTAQVVTLYTDANGAFTLPNRKPGSYTIYASQYGYTFNSQSVTIGPDALGVVIPAN